jgi:hypothetical protein
MGGLPPNPTPADWGAKTTGLAELVASITPSTPNSPGGACYHGPPVPGTTDFNFWTPDGPPRAYVDPNGKTHLIVPHMLTFQFVGDSLAGVQLDCSAVLSQSTFDASSADYDDASWPWAPYLLGDGRLFAVYHHEYHGESHGNCQQTPGPVNPENCWHPALTFGFAPNGSAPNAPGISRPVPNHVIAHWNNADPVGGGGFSDPTNIMLNPADGKYYMMALVRGTLKPDGTADNVLRNCMLRTSDLTNPDAWQTWDGGAFVGPLHNGAQCADVTGMDEQNPAAPGSLVYSTYFNRVLYLTFGKRADGRHGFFVRVALNDELTQWSKQIIVLGVDLPWGAYPPLHVSDVYPSFLDPAAGAVNFDKIGQAPYLYWVRTFNGDQTVLHREIWRVPLQFYAGAPERDNRIQGFFRIGGGAYYANGLGSYCSIVSPLQLSGCGYSGAFDALPELPDGGADMPQSPNPVCACGYNPPGCYAVGPGGYFANGQGASCPLLGCQLPRICGTSDFATLPQRPNTGPDQINPPCTNPPGCYRDGAAGYYSNGQGASCEFLGSQLQALCGTNDFFSLPVGCLGGDKLDPPCQ